MDKEKQFISAVIYVRNAEERIESFLSTVIDMLEEHFEHSEIICVNDASEDGSPQKIAALGNCAGRIAVSMVNMSCFHGLELSMDAGRDLAIGDYVLEFDHTVPDFDPDVIMKIYRRCLEGYDIVSAVPDRREKFFSRLFYSVFDHNSHLNTKMHTESFRILSRRVINRIDSMNLAVPYRKAVYASQGLKTDQMVYKPVIMPEEKEDRRLRGYRTSLAIDSLILFTSVGYRFSMVMTAVMMLISVCMILYTVIVYAMAHPVAGWTTTILFLSVAFFSLFAILTVIIKYLQILVDLVFRRKRYTFESIQKFSGGEK